MDRQAIVDAVRLIVANITGLAPGELDGRANFIDDLGIESVMAVDIVTEVEKQYGVDIPVEKFGEIDSIDALADIIYGLSERVG